MHLTDLESGETRDISVGEGERIKPLGFLGTDCIYGIARAENVSEQTGIFAMSQVVIVDTTDESLAVLKTYNSEGSYVTGAEVINGTIYLDRAVYSNGVYSDAEPDTIRNRDMQEKEQVYVSETTDSVKQRQVTLQLSGEISSSPSLVIPQLTVSDESVELQMDGEFDGSTYYVYAKGKVLMGTNSVTEAIASADENRGVVVDKNQNYVWKCAKKQSQSLEISAAGGNSAAAKALAIMLNQAGTGADTDALLNAGNSVYDILSETVSDRSVYNLTGCSLEQVLYYVGAGSPVYGVQNGRPVLLTGYNDGSVVIYNPDSGSRESRSISTASEEFAVSGNQFYAVSVQ